MSVSGKHRKSWSKGKKHEDDKYKKYIGNQQEGQGFADKRKKKMQYEYMKLMKKEKRKNRSHNMIKDPTFTEYKQHEQNAKCENSSQRKREKDQSSPKISKYAVTQQNHRKKQEDKHKRQQEILTQRMKRDSALGKYKQEKQKNFKKLCKRTCKGQPVMRNQIEVLLRKIVKEAT